MPRLSLFELLPNVIEVLAVVRPPPTAVTRASVVARSTERSVAIAARASSLSRAVTTLTLSNAATSVAPSEMRSAATVHAVPFETWRSATSPAWREGSTSTRATEARPVHAVPRSSAKTNSVVTSRPVPRLIPTCVFVGPSSSLVITRASDGEDLRVTPDTRARLASTACADDYINARGRLDQSVYGSYSQRDEDRL